MLIGRENEIATLHGLMSSDESQFVAVYGRRRVGKTFLIREAYKSHFVFQHTGTYGATRRQQLSDFRESLYLPEWENAQCLRRGLRHLDCCGIS